MYPDCRTKYGKKEHTVSRSVFIIVLFLLLSGLWTFTARHTKRIRESIILSGGWFGLLGFIANWLYVENRTLDVFISFRSIPPFLAAFFFHPASGLIAGLCAIAGKIGISWYNCTSWQNFLRLDWNDKTLPWQIGTLTIGVTACYAAGVAKWIFEKKQPPFIVAATAAAYGTILYFGVIVLLGIGMNDFPRALLILDVSYPVIPITSGLAAALASLICVRRKKWDRRFFAPLTWGFLLFGIVFAVMTFVAVNRAYFKTSRALKDAEKTLMIQLEDQIAILLHHRAAAIRERLKKEPELSMAVMQNLAHEYRVNEVNLFAADGRLIATSDPKVWHHNQTCHSRGALEEFFKLTSGEADFVKSEFRASRSDNKVKAKYIGLPFRERGAFLQLGYHWKQLEEEFGNFFLPMFGKAKLETLGCFIVTDPAGRIAAEVAGHPEAKGKLLSELSRAVYAVGEEDKNIFELNLFGVYGRGIRCQDIGRWQIRAFLPYEENFDDTLVIVMVTAILLFFIGVAVRLVYLHAARMREKIDAMREADLLLANTIQRSELQQEPLETPACRVTATMTPAKEVGGDFYSYDLLPDGRIAVAIADVSGKGVPAAFFMIKAKGLLQNELLRGRSLKDAVEESNRLLHRNNDACMFVTAWVGIFDPQTGLLESVSAGHNPPLVRRADGSVIWLNPAKRQKPLAAFAKAVYATEELKLSPGDRLFLYTDGVTEAMNPKGELFGTERLEKNLGMASGDLIFAVQSELAAFMAEAPQADDITILTMEIRKS